jgi:hypothetical protein
MSGNGERLRLDGTERALVERLAAGVYALAAAVLGPRLLFPVLGYVISLLVTERITRDGAAATLAGLHAYIAESIATGFDIGTGQTGHGVNVSIKTPDGAWLLR